MAGQPDLATGHDYIRSMITYAMTNGGIGNEEAILSVKRRIEALPLNRHGEPGMQTRARADNERGVKYLRDGQVAEAVLAFQAGYQRDPTDAEIINNFGYAYLRHHDPEAAEPWLLLALVLTPGRVNAWVNLGQAYAKQGQRSMAVACLANGYRFSKHQAATRQFLHKLAEDEDDEVREAARQTLQLPLVQTGKD
jgi:Flp pilus assembly protein TadD